MHGRSLFMKHISAHGRFKNTNLEGKKKWISTRKTGLDNLKGLLIQTRHPKRREKINDNE